MVVDAREFIGPPPPDNWIDELAELIRARLPAHMILEEMILDFSPMVRRVRVLAVSAATEFFAALATLPTCA